jgi:hypothetical protein
MAFTVEDLNDLIRILKHHPEWCMELRRVLLTDELLQLPELMRELIEVSRQHSAAIAELTEAQRYTEQRLQQLSEEFAAYRQLTDQRFAELTATVQRLSEEFAAYRQLTDQRFAETSQQIAELVGVMRDMLRRLERLEEWQRGEAGRRAGEQYEQRVIRRAVNIFLGGEGGAPEKPSVYRRLAQWLRILRQQGRIPDTGEDPLLADLIWWKGEKVLVVKVSLKVDDSDIERARLRAATLREIGVDATPVVIGEEWAAPEVQARAQQEQVEWMVGSGLSQGFLQFRRLPDEVEPEATEH